MAGLTTGQLTNVLAYACGFLTAFFVVCGLGKRDLLIFLGLICMAAGDVFFARHLWLQREGGANITFVTFYVCCAAAAAYAVGHQLSQYRARGCGDDEEDEEGERDGWENDKMAVPADNVSRIDKPAVHIFGDKNGVNELGGSTEAARVRNAAVEGVEVRRRCQA